MTDPGVVVSGGAGIVLPAPVALGSDWVIVFVEGAAVAAVPTDPSAFQVWTYLDSPGSALVAQDQPGAIDAAERAMRAGVLPASYITDAGNTIRAEAEAARQAEIVALQARIAQLQGP